MRLLIVQYAGDYREAVQRFAQDGEETYYAQKYTVEAVAELAKRADLEQVATLCCLTETAYDEVLPNGVRAIGAGLQNSIDPKRVIYLIEQFQPTHLLLRTPMRPVLEWAIQHRVKTMASLADSFHGKGWRTQIRNFLLARSLNHPQVEWISNHGTNSCLSLQSIGVKPTKIIPWDYPAFVTPETYAPKAAPSPDRPLQLLYVGSLTEDKGVGDVLEAIALLNQKAVQVQLKLAGRGATEQFQTLAQQLNIAKQVNFLGLIPHRSVVPLMHEADVVLIPSRHEYPEGLPCTIYEALCARTPIVASDHPMFHQKLIDQVNAVVYPARNSQALAMAIEALRQDAALYHRLSTVSSEAWRQLQIPVKWADLIDRWLNHSSDNQQWLQAHSLASGRYTNSSLHLVPQPA